MARHTCGHGRSRYLAGARGMLSLAACLVLTTAAAQDLPPVPENASDSVVAAAIREAQEELGALGKAQAEELNALDEKIVAKAADVEALRAREAELLKQSKKLAEDLSKLEEKVVEATGKLEFEVESLNALGGEIYNQASALKRRFFGTLVDYEDPEIVRAADRLIGKKIIEPGEQVTELLRLYERVLGYAGSVSTLRVPAQLSGGQGEIVEVQALRLGLVGGYYLSSKAGDAGFLTKGEGDSNFLTESRGLSALQKAEIAALVEKPSQGGMLPTDVTGGAGLATFQSRYSLAEWFRLGGVFMYPLLAVFVIGMLIIAERGIMLLIKSWGISRHTRRVITLVQGGQFAAAQEYCEEAGGATGAVLNAALIHREHGRGAMEDAVQEALLHHAPAFHSRLGFVALCAAISPLLGLLGTVTGMITTFKMVTLFGTSDPRFMAGGISEALITTQAGLFVAIPCLLLRGVLGAGADASVAKLETGAVSVVLAAAKREQAAEPEPSGWKS